MDDFLYVLKIKLSESLPESEVSRQVSAYEEYINEKLAAGDLPDKIYRELGDPAEVARLVTEDYIKRMRESAGRESAFLESSFDDFNPENTAEEINANIKNPKYGIKAEFTEEGGWNVHIGKLKLNSWAGTLLILFIVFGIVALIKFIAG